MLKINNTDWFIETMLGCAMGLAVEDKLHEEQSPYQKIEVYQTQTFGRLMVIDGCTMLTSRDNFIYHEMMTHPVLFTHPQPCEVVIIGGGDCGTLQQVLQHDTVKKATQIDIDERVTRVSEQYFPELCTHNQDPRATLLFDDGIRWIQGCSPNSLDVIIVDSTDPEGPGKVLFTEDFYRACWNALRDGGILVQQSESPLLHTDSIIVPMHKILRGAGFALTRTLHFPLMIYPSGWWTATMGCKNQDFPTFREADARQKSFATQYYNADIHQASLVLPNFLQEALRSQ